MNNNKYKLALEKCRKQRDHYIQKYNDSMIVKGVDISQEVKENNEELELILNPQDEQDLATELNVLSLDAKPGTKVKYLEKNGYDSDKTHANKFLKKGQEYTVLNIFVGGWESKVTLKEFPEQFFNTVMFSEI